jgi:hypothetical protein
LAQASFRAKLKVEVGVKFRRQKSGFRIRKPAINDVVGLRTPESNKGPGLKIAN